MDIDLCGSGIYMSEQRLDVLNVDAILKQMAGKAMTAAMAGYLFCNPRFGCTFLEVLIDTALVKISSRPGTGEKNVSGLTTLEPILRQKIKVPIGKYRISIPPAFALTDMNGFIGA